MPLLLAKVPVGEHGSLGTTRLPTARFVPWCEALQEQRHRCSPCTAIPRLMRVPEGKGSSKTFPGWKGRAGTYRNRRYMLEAKRSGPCRGSKLRTTIGKSTSDKRHESGRSNSTESPLECWRRCDRWSGSTAHWCRIGGHRPAAFKSDRPLSSGEMATGNSGQIGSLNRLATTQLQMNGGDWRSNRRQCIRETAGLTPRHQTGKLAVAVGHVVLPKLLPKRCIARIPSSRRHPKSLGKNA